MPVYDQEYIKSKVKEFNGIVNINFLDNEVSREGVHYTCITCISTESVMRIERKNYPQTYLEQYKYKKKKKIPKFIDVDLESDFSSDSE